MKTINMKTETYENAEEKRQPTEVWRMYGGYRMCVLFWPYGAQVTMYDYGNIKWPMEWSKSMTHEQAHAALDLFEKIGYFDMPMDV